MKDLKDYEEYESLYKDDLVVAVRKLLNAEEDLDIFGQIDYEQDPKQKMSDAYSLLMDYFNKFYLFKKLKKTEFNKYNKEN
jgi:hypothetical protein